MGGILAGRTDLELVVVGQMAFASNVREQVGHIAEAWFLRADGAEKGYSCHCGDGRRRQRSVGGSAVQCNPV